MCEGKKKYAEKPRERRWRQTCFYLRNKCCQLKREGRREVGKRRFKQIILKTVLQCCKMQFHVLYNSMASSILLFIYVKYFYTITYSVMVLLSITHMKYFTQYNFKNMNN